MSNTAPFTELVDGWRLPSRSLSLSEGRRVCRQRGAPGSGGEVEASASDGGLVSVDVAGWDEPGDAVLDGDGPVVVVDAVVVEGAEEYAVVEVGGAAL